MMLDLGDLILWILAHRTTIGTGFILLALRSLLNYLRSKKLNFDAPVVGDQTDLRSALLEGYKKVRMQNDRYGKEN